MSDDDIPTLAPDPRLNAPPSRAALPPSSPRTRFSAEVVVLGIFVLALLLATVLTLLSIGNNDEKLQIGLEPTAPNPTFDASISDVDGSSAVAGRDISITDEPIVIDADGNVVDPNGGNGGAALPSEANASGDSGGVLALPADVFTGTEPGSAADASPSQVSNADDAVPPVTDPDQDNGTNLLGGNDPEDKLMPDLICRGLQAAQDEIQDRGVFGSKSKDATGAGRRQIWDRNWIVVAQDPEPGEKIGEFEAILYVVKKGDDANICD